MDCAREMRGTSSIAKLVMRRALQRPHEIVPRIRLHEADDHRALLQAVDGFDRGRLHAQEDIGARQDRRLRRSIPRPHRLYR